MTQSYTPGPPTGVGTGSEDTSGKADAAVVDVKPEATTAVDDFRAQRRTFATRPKSSNRKGIPS